MDQQDELVVEPLTAGHHPELMSLLQLRDALLLAGSSDEASHGS